MSIYSKLLVCAAVPAFLLLTACSGGSGEPSSSEIKAALDADLKIANDAMQKQLASIREMPGGDQIPEVKLELKEVKKQKCDKQEDNSYSCTVEIKIAAPTPIGNQTIEQVINAPIIFTKADTGWKTTGGGIPSLPSLPTLTN